MPSEIDAFGMYFAYDEKLLSSLLSSSLLLTLPLDVFAYDEEILRP